MALYTLGVTNFRGNWYAVLQDSRSILCYFVGGLACAISITVVSERPIICNLTQIAVLEPFADSISLTFECTCLLDKKNKKGEKKDIPFLFLKFKWNDNAIWFFSPLMMGVSQGPEEKKCVKK